MSEFEKFQRSMAADFLKWQADIISDYKRPDQFITNNLGFSWKKFGTPIAHDGYSYGVQRSINFYEASQSLTLAASDIYHPTQDQLTGAEISFGGDVTRSLKDNNYLVMECQAQAFKYWTPYPVSLGFMPSAIWHPEHLESCIGTGILSIADTRHTGKDF